MPRVSRRASSYRRTTRCSISRAVTASRSIGSFSAIRGDDNVPRGAQQRGAFIDERYSADFDGAQQQSGGSGDDLLIGGRAAFDTSDVLTQWGVNASDEIVFYTIFEPDLAEADAFIEARETTVGHIGPDHNNFYLGLIDPAGSTDDLDLAASTADADAFIDDLYSFNRDGTSESGAQIITSMDSVTSNEPVGLDGSGGTTGWFRYDTVDPGTDELEQFTDGGGGADANGNWVWNVIVTPTSAGMPDHPDFFLI
jgi:hypothetical protein